MATSIQPQFSGAHLNLNESVLRLSAGARNVHPMLREVYNHAATTARNRRTTLNSANSCQTIASQQEVDTLLRAAAEKARTERATEDT